MMNDPWPEELRLRKQGAELAITFEGADQFSYAAEYLRVESPSAEVKGHGPGQEITVSGKRNVRISRLEPIGNYAVRIVFDDGHNTGLYTWPLLHRLGLEKDRLWASYLGRLAAKGMSRD